MGVMSKVASTFAFVLLHLSLTASAVEYFPSEPGPVFEYVGGPVSITMLGPSEFARVTCAECSVGTSEVFGIGEDHDVYQLSYGSFTHAAPDPEHHGFQPLLKYLDFPLETGKTWTTIASQYDLYGGFEDTVTLTVTVVGPKSVSVPAGNFDVIEVLLSYQHSTWNWLNRTDSLWLHRQLGPVAGLLSWDGVVAIEIQSWGSIKALYR